MDSTLVLYGKRLLAQATPRNSPRHRGGEPCLESLQGRDDEVFLCPAVTMGWVRCQSGARGLLILGSDQELHILNIVSFPPAFRIEVGRVTEITELKD